MNAPSELRQNAAQFALLVLINAFVGGMVGLERSILPALAEDEFGLAARSAILSFIVVFGLTKAAANYVAGRLSDRVGRRGVLIAGWLVALPVPWLLAWAPSWGWVVATNALLGISQGLTWSTTVIMKIDLAGSRHRGLAMGLNEFAGYLAVAGSALATAWIAERYGLRPAPFVFGGVLAIVGTALSVLFARETRRGVTTAQAPPPPDIFARTTWRDPTLASVSQAGFVNNLNDGLAWGIFPLLHAAAGLGLAQIGVLAAIYPAVWGLGQLVTGAASDRLGRKGFIVGGMALQAVGLWVVATSTAFDGFALGAALLGLGTAMVYPTLLAVVGDVASPSWRGSAVGVYRLWRDSGYAAGAILAGLLADAWGLAFAVQVVAVLTLLSGVVAQARLRETVPVLPSVQPGSQPM